MADYGLDSLTYDATNQKENKLRSPIHFLDAIKSPTFIIEGEKGNIQSFNEIQQLSKNNNIQFVAITGGDHFNSLAPLNGIIAKKIIELDDESKIIITSKELQNEFDEFQSIDLEIQDLQTLAMIRHDRVNLTNPQNVGYYLLSRNRTKLDSAVKAARKQHFKMTRFAREKSENGQEYYFAVLSKNILLTNLKALFESSKTIKQISYDNGTVYDGWDVHGK